MKNGEIEVGRRITLSDRKQLVGPGNKARRKL